MPAKRKLFFKNTEEDRKKYDAIKAAYNHQFKLAIGGADGHGVAFLPGSYEPNESSDKNGLYLELSFNDEAQMQQFLRDQHANLSRTPTPPPPPRLPAKTRVEPAPNESITPFIEKYNLLAKKAGTADEYKSGFSEPTPEAEGVKFTFPNDSARDSFLGQLAKEGGKFTAHDDAGEVIAISKGDGTLHLKGAPTFFKAQLDLAEEQRKAKADSGATGGTSDDEDDEELDMGHSSSLH
ncbi:MAG: hypothetical protein K0U37_01895 [Gammaproteobacteria bacterium]|nr:hypothetical protein [Gammaproteobacteria bacterium]